MLVYRNGLPPDAGISINYRIYDRFLIRRLQAKTNISTDVLYDLQYADYAAVPSDSAAELEETESTRTSVLASWSIPTKWESWFSRLSQQPA